MLGTAIAVSTINVIVYGTLAQRVHPDALKLCAGYSFWVDLLFTGIVAGMAVATGSLTALIISSVTGLFISFSLYAVKWVHGSAKFAIVKEYDVEKGKDVRRIRKVFSGPTGLPKPLSFLSPIVSRVACICKA